MGRYELIQEPGSLMRYLALAADYDGTLADRSRVEEPTVKALRRLKATGRRLILATGRELPELLEVFPEVGLFDRVVAENGALLYDPERRSERILAAPPPRTFVERLEAMGVGPISVGRVVVATWQPHQAAVMEAIREMGLDLQVILNKRAIMVLPTGVDKKMGLDAALSEMGISHRNVVGVGDAENDRAFLDPVGCAVAVANALDTLKEKVDWTTAGDHGRGVVELIERLEAGDLQELEPNPIRRCDG